MQIPLSLLQKFIQVYETENINNDDLILLKEFYVRMQSCQLPKHPRGFLMLTDQYAFDFSKMLLTIDKTVSPKLELLMSEFWQGQKKYHLDILEILLANDLLDYPNSQLLEHQNADHYQYIKEILFLAKASGLLTDRIFKLIAKLTYPVLILTYPLRFYLSDEYGDQNIRNEKNLEDILLSKNPSEYYSSLEKLCSENLYHPESLEILRQYSDTPFLGVAVAKLKDAGLDTKENITFLTEPLDVESKYIHYCYDRADALVLAKKFKLKQKTQAIFLKHLSCHLVEAFKNLEILDDELVINAVKVEPLTFKSMIAALKRHFTLYQPYVSELLKNPSTEILQHAILVLEEDGVNYQGVVKPNLLSEDAMNKLLSVKGIDYATAVSLLHFSDFYTHQSVYHSDNVQRLFSNKALNSHDQAIVEKLVFAIQLGIKKYEVLQNSSVNVLEIASRHGLVSETFIRFNERVNIKKIKTIEDLNKIIIANFDAFPEMILTLAEIFDRDYHENLSDESLAKIMNVANHHPNIHRLLSEKFGRLLYIEFFDRGASRDTWTDLSWTLFERLPKPKAKPKARLIDELFKDTPHLPVEHFNIQDYLQAGWKVLRTQGRTLLLEDQEQNILAIKIQKPLEDIKELEKEYRAAAFLNEHKETLNLDCYFPKPLGIFSLNYLFLEPLGLDQLNSLVNLIGLKTDYHAYVYKVDKAHRDYFTYLHDPILSNDEFNIASQRALKNMLLLLGQGFIFNQVADLFHNTEAGKDRRADLGRFIVLSNLLSPMALDGRPNGLGRLTGWMKAVEFPNLRGPNAPLPDLGDSISYLTCLFEGKFAKKFFLHANREFKEKVIHYLLANFIAEYQYVLFLISGKRGVELTKRATLAGKSEEEINNIWLLLAKQVVNNCALAVSLFGFKSQYQAKQLLETFINVNRLAAQMKMFMTKEYIHYMQKEKLPKEIYGEQTTVNIQFSNFRDGTFNANNGFSINGVDPDLGPVNGQEPIKEMNKLIYTMVNQILSSYLDFKLTMDAFKKNGRHTFFHLSGKEYHAAKIELDKQLLLSNGLSKEVSDVITNDLNHHQREKAACTIQTAWRYRKLH